MIIVYVKRPCKISLEVLSIIKLQKHGFENNLIMSEDLRLNSINSNRKRHFLNDIYCFKISELARYWHFLERKACAEQLRIELLEDCENHLRWMREREALHKPPPPRFNPISFKITPKNCVPAFNAYRVWVTLRLCCQRIKYTVRPLSTFYPERAQSESGATTGSKNLCNWILSIILYWDSFIFWKFCEFVYFDISIDLIVAVCINRLIIHGITRILSFLYFVKGDIREKTILIMFHIFLLTRAL